MDVQQSVNELSFKFDDISFNKASVKENDFNFSQIVGIFFKAKRPLNIGWKRDIYFRIDHLY